jgi:hypothetical protein
MQDFQRIDHAALENVTGGAVDPVKLWKGAKAVGKFVYNWGPTIYDAGKGIANYFFPHKETPPAPAPAPSKP